MCYNCGCGMSDNDMGHPENITETTFQAAAQASGQTAEEAKRETLKLLKQELGEG